MKTLRWQFFALPDETWPAVIAVSETEGLALFEQLPLPGLILRRISGPELETGQTRLFLTAQHLPEGPQAGTVDATGVTGAVQITMPFADQENLYMGEISTRVDPQNTQDSAAARHLIRLMRARAHLPVFVRGSDQASARAAPGLGATDGARLFADGSRSLRQYGVENVDYLL